MSKPAQTSFLSLAVGKRTQADAFLDTTDKVVPWAARVAPGTIGVHLRTWHPGIVCDIGRAVAAINRLAETAPVFLACDAKLPGLSSEVMTGPGARPACDGDRRRATILTAPDDWRTLGRCAVIYRNSPRSTFADYWCFGTGLPIRRLA